MDFYTYIKLITDAYSNGYKKAIEDSGGLPTYLSLNQAYKKYKRKRVDQWVRLKLITLIPSSEKKNGAYKLLRERLELLASLSYLDIQYGKIPPEILPENIHTNE